jgi:spermidine/putrescine transport system substrate-binding protein
MDSAEENKTPKYLNYALPEEGSNVWFDGWCMPKGANKELAEAFVNFICDPENAALCMDAVGYTSPVVGNDIWELVNDWYAAEESEEDTYEVDLSFYFGETIEGEAKIEIPTSEKGRQFDAQYPTEEALKRCCIMKDFGTQQEKVEKMWKSVKQA